MKDALGKPVFVGDYIAHMGGMYAGIEGSIVRVNKLTPQGISGITQDAEVFYDDHPEYPRKNTKTCMYYTIINITKLLDEQEKF